MPRRPRHIAIGSMKEKPRGDWLCGEARDTVTTRVFHSIHGIPWLARFKLEFFRVLQGNSNHCLKPWALPLPTVLQPTTHSIQLLHITNRLFHTLRMIQSCDRQKPLIHNHLDYTIPKIHTWASRTIPRSPYFLTEHPRVEIA